MQIVKPLSLGILHRTFAYRGQRLFSATLLLGFSLTRREVLLEPDLWSKLAQGLGKDALFDAAMPKAQGEVLLAGRFFAPGGQPVGAGHVRLRLGAVDKRLAVFGDRYWRTGLGPSEPTPMAEMPLSYERAFGGEGYQPNPVGRGLRPSGEEGEQRLWLPNVEYPEGLIAGPSDRPPPASFGRRDLTWAPRSGWTGSYDETWRRERAPGLPDDIDWRHFNDAPEDQWREGYWRGDEAFELEHLHPEQPLLRGQLPGCRGRCFVRRQVEAGFRLEELPLKLDTVWLIPHLDLGVCLYRATTEVADAFAADIAQILLAYENLADAPRDQAHYAAALDRRLDPKEGYKYLLSTADLIPDDASGDFERLQAQHDLPFDQLLHANQMAGADEKRGEALARVEEQKQALAEVLKAQGLDPAEYLARLDSPAPDPVMARIQALMDKALPKRPDGQLDLARLDFAVLEELDRELKALAASKQSDAVAETRALIDQLRAQPEAPADQIAALEARLAALDGPPPLPRPPGQAEVDNLRQLKADFERQCEEMRRLGAREEDLPRLDLDLPALEAKFLAAAGKVKQAYAMGAHLLPRGLPPHHGDEAALAAEVLACHGRGESLRDRDLAGISLAGADLRGIDLSGCYLEDVDLSGADLSGALLAGAILPRARLVGARFSDARLAGANLGASLIEDADFRGADLAGATLAGAVLRRADFRAADLRGVNLLELKPESADFGDARLDQLAFLELDLRGCRFAGAGLGQASLLNCRLEGVDFSGCDAEAATFVDCGLDGAVFAGARLVNVRFVGKSSLRGADFSAALLERANLRDMPLQGGRFAGGRFDQTDFSGSLLAGADFAGGSGQRSLFLNSDLEGARLKDCNLMESGWLGARLTAADLRNSNLYAANFLNATLGQTRFDDANLDRTILVDWRPA